jgi:CDP-glycerol glycerophosphotransferase (TagB/SpsB family)
VSRRQDVLRAGIVRLAFALGRRTPLRRRVVLATSHAARIGGNLGWIRDELAARHPGVPVHLVARAVAPGRRAQALALVDGALAGWRLATSRVTIVDDYYFPMYPIVKRQGTTFIQAWHACGAFKKFGYSVLDRSFGADEAFVARYPIHTNYDLCLVSAARFAPFYSEAFRQPLDRFTARLGIPRTDLFFDEARRSAAAKAVRARYGIPADHRVILYAPTFRGERITAARNPTDLDLELLRRELGSDHVLLLRAHPFVPDRMRDRVSVDGFVVDVSDHPEINELMLVSDVLLTDYSSAIYEFSLLERPIVFFAPDHEAYVRERGFYLDLETDLPGPMFETSAEVAAHLRAGAFDLDRIRHFRDASFDVADGASTRRLVDEVIAPALA